jgi:proteasome lid subunit RPN8/RPN11
MLLGQLLLPVDALAHESPEPPLPTRLVIERPLLSKLQALAAGLHVELVLCLQGVTAGNDMRLTHFSMPEPRVATGDRSSFLPCPDNTVAVWHNHPISDPSTYPDTRRPRREPVHPRELCALSKSDIRTTARLGYPFIVVSVDAETWCWWTRDQVKRFARQGSTLGRPIAGQVSWLESDPRLTRRTF